MQEHDDSESEMEEENDLIGALFSDEEGDCNMSDQEESEDDEDSTDEDQPATNEEQEEEQEDDTKGEKLTDDEYEEEDDGDKEEDKVLGEAEREEGDTISIEIQNITELAKNYSFMLESEADVYFVQECKVKEEEKGKVVNKVKAENYEAAIGPCNKDTKKPSAWGWMYK